MSRIRILPEILSNKIAAGEVVQRPASVVKELIENSIDAKSKKITIEIKKGGISLIRVSDDGIGMNKDDALLSLERYATSKIRNDHDLFSIKTLGFRGEAIPSISSVSKFSIVTREYQDSISTKIEVRGGRVQNVSDCGSPQGTIITVKDLFFNVPARKNFIKSVSIETSHITDVVVSMAIARPEIRFKLLHNGRVIKDLLNFNDPISRISDVLGSGSAKYLLPLKSEHAGVSIRGWIGKHEINRSTSKGIYFFINGRHIKNQAMYQSLTLAYKERMVKGRYPIAILFIDLAYDQVDVNVHPTKREVRFLNQEQVCNFLHSLINQNLQKLGRLKRDYSALQSYGVDNYLRKTIYTNSNYAAENHAEEKIQLGYNMHGTRPDIPQNPEKSKYGLNTQSVLWEENFFSDLTIIGQHYNTYIICSRKESLILIDQHAAHERVLFEELKLNIKKKTPLSQGILLTELIETNFSEAEILEKLIPYLNEYGLKIKPFGGTTFIIKSIPVPLTTSKVPKLIGELIKKASNVGIHKHKKDIQEAMMFECLTVMSCHGAIKAGLSLSYQEIKTLISQLDSCENSSYCPHGRPTWIKLELSDLEKKFSRR